MFDVKSAVPRHHRSTVEVVFWQTLVSDLTQMVDSALLNGDQMQNEGKRTQTSEKATQNVLLYINQTSVWLNLTNTMPNNFQAERCCTRVKI